MIKKTIQSLLSCAIGAFVLLSCSNQPENKLREAFRTPGNQYRPMPFWHINGELTTDGIEKQLTEAKELSGFGGVTVLPVNSHPQVGTGLPCPGTTPLYLSEAYFDRYKDILETSRKLGTEVILYDDIDFPSGSAGGRLRKEYPEYTLKHLIKEEHTVSGPREIRLTCSDSSLLMAVSGMNVKTLEIKDLKKYMNGTDLIWKVPEGDWKIMFFRCRFNVNQAVDYMQPEAAAKVITMTYDEYSKRFSPFFGNVITKTFYDDVGFVHQEEAWTPAITELFEKKYNKSAALYYPALYYNIGAETQAARVAFYDIRSELMAEGYVKQVAEWCEKNHLKSMGHPPESYSPNSVVANGDILKYYRHTQIPLMDAIFYYGRGMHGFKQVSSAADAGDKPVVGAEIYGAFSATMDSLTLYRLAMDVMARGVNFIVPHGMWYHTDKDKVRIPPLISHENPLLGKSLHRYSDFVARSCMLLQGGRRVSEIAVLWPIAAIQAESYINRDKESGLPVANWLPDGVHHQALSDLLTNQIRRDFTFIHPEDLTNGKIRIDTKELVLNNQVNRQNYKVLMIPGGEVISVAALKAIKTYYEGGGKVIFTGSLPCKSAEFGQDQEIKEIISDIFDDWGGYPEYVDRTNTKEGIAVYIQTCDRESLHKVFDRMHLNPDLIFENVSLSGNEKGYLNYIHKQKENKDIYFISNSTDQQAAIQIQLRGDKKPEIWNPFNGEILKIEKKERIKRGGDIYTKIDVSLTPVSSLFLISEQ